LPLVKIVDGRAKPGHEGNAQRRAELPFQGEE